MMLYYVSDVIFASLPKVPEDEAAAHAYIDELDQLSGELNTVIDGFIVSNALLLTAGLPPTVMVHGNMPVISNDL